MEGLDRRDHEILGRLFPLRAILFEDLGTYPLLHLGCGLIGKGQRKDLRYRYAACPEEVDIFLDQHVGLPVPAPAVTTMLRSCLVIASPCRSVAAISGLLRHFKDPVGIEAADALELAVLVRAFLLAGEREAAISDTIDIRKRTIPRVLYHAGKILGNPGPGDHQVLCGRIREHNAPVHFAPDRVIAPADPVVAGDLLKREQVERQLEGSSRFDILCLGMLRAGLVIIDQEVPSGVQSIRSIRPRMKTLRSPSGETSSTGSGEDAGSSDAVVPMPRNIQTGTGQAGNPIPQFHAPKIVRNTRGRCAGPQASGSGWRPRAGSGRSTCPTLLSRSGGSSRSHQPGWWIHPGLAGRTPLPVKSTQDIVDGRPAIAGREVRFHLRQGLEIDHPV